MKILNLGCGVKIANNAEVMNIDWSPLLRLKSNPVFSRLAPFLLDARRYERFSALTENVVVHDLSKGVPFPDNSIDAVYHSHMLEHLDRFVVPHFMKEMLRVLKPGGVHRIVVPDWELLCRDYISDIEACDAEEHEVEEHEHYIRDMLEQSVRREASGTALQKPMRRFLENMVLGDARKRGETHQWMYDRFTLGNLLKQAGFSNPRQVTRDSSCIQNWQEYNLDVAHDGRELNPGSLYMEAVKL